MFLIVNMLNIAYVDYSIRKRCGHETKSKENTHTEEKDSEEDFDIFKTIENVSANVQSFFTKQVPRPWGTLGRTFNVLVEKSKGE